MSRVIFQYDAKKNPDGLYIDGVPLGDLTDDDVAAMSSHQLAGVVAQPFYVKVGRMPSSVNTAEVTENEQIATTTPDTSDKISGRKT